MFCANIYSNQNKPYSLRSKIYLPDLSQKTLSQVNRKECPWEHVWSFDKKNIWEFLQRKSWFGMFSEWNDGYWTETFGFEFDCFRKKKIFDLIKLFLEWCYYIISFYVLNINNSKWWIKLQYWIELKQCHIILKNHRISD